MAYGIAYKQLAEVAKSLHRTAIDDGTCGKEKAMCAKELVSVRRLIREMERKPPLRAACLKELPPRKTRKNAIANLEVAEAA
jgi:hypothetical protein